MPIVDFYCEPEKGIIYILTADLGILSKVEDILFKLTIKTERKDLRGRLYVYREASEGDNDYERLWYRDYKVSVSSFKF
jgi:hypothetical protein